MGSLQSLKINRQHAPNCWIGSRHEDVTEINEFADWILKVGDGEIGGLHDGEVFIDTPEDILIHETDDPVQSVIDFTYPNLLNHIDDPSYFQ